MTTPVADQVQPCVVHWAGPRLHFSHLHHGLVVLRPKEKEGCRGSRTPGEEKADHLDSVLKDPLQNQIFPPQSAASIDFFDHGSSA